jgi:hypothetical protein
MLTAANKSRSGRLVLQPALFEAGLFLTATLLLCKPLLLPAALVSPPLLDAPPFLRLPAESGLVFPAGEQSRTPGNADAYRQVLTALAPMLSGLLLRAAANARGAQGYAVGH